MTVLPVAPGTAEQLARLHYLRALDGVDLSTVDSLASFLLGDVGGDRAVWLNLEDDCGFLWSLMEGRSSSRAGGQQPASPPASPPAQQELGDDWVPEPPADWEPEGAEAGAR